MSVPDEHIDNACHRIAELSGAAGPVRTPAQTPTIASTTASRASVGRSIHMSTREAMPMLSQRFKLAFSACRRP